MSYIHERIAKITGMGDDSFRPSWRVPEVGGELVPDRDSSFEEDEHYVFLPDADRQLGLYADALSAMRTSESLVATVHNLGDVMVGGAQEALNTPAPTVPSPRQPTHAENISSGTISSNPAYL